MPNYGVIRAQILAGSQSHNQWLTMIGVSSCKALFQEDQIVHLIAYLHFVEP